MFCASQAATAICTSLEQQHVVSSSTTIYLGSGPAIDRHNPIIHGSRRSVSSSAAATATATATVKKPTSKTAAPSPHPKAQQNPKAGKKSTWSKLGENVNNNNTQEKKSSDEAAATERRSCASLVDAVRKSSCIRPSAYFTPPASKRYLLLENNQSFDKQPNTDRVLAMETERVTESKPVRSTSLKNGAPLFVPASDKYFGPFPSNSNQVVVVRVSLHCKGCAGKVKKHISRMQGVTYFNIDFDAKKVTVEGDVTALEVLASISKVRTAQLLPPEKPYATTNTKQVIREVIKI